MFPCKQDQPRHISEWNTNLLTSKQITDNKPLRKQSNIKWQNNDSQEIFIFKKQWTQKGSKDEEKKMVYSCKNTTLQSTTKQT